MFKFLTILAPVYLVLCLMLAGCSGRKRDNPLDPLNQSTEGRLTGLSVVSDHEMVRLSWDALREVPIKSYYIYRSSTASSPAQETQSGQSFYIDRRITLGERYVYRVSVLTSSGYQSPLSDSVMITPGPHNYWVCDFNGRFLYRMTYDGMHYLTRYSEIFYPTACAWDADAQQLWVADWYAGMIVAQNLSGEYVENLDGFKKPNEIVLDSNQNLYILHDSSRQVIRYNTVTQERDTISHFQKVTDIDPAELNMGCWLTDGQAGQVGLITEQGVWQVISHTLASPLAVAQMPKQNWAWVSDSTALYQIDYNGLTTLRYTFEEGAAAMLSVDESSGACWVGIRNQTGKADRVIKIGFFGNKLVEVEGFTDIRSIAADSFSGGCLIADLEASALVRLNAFGIKVDENLLLSGPFHIIVEQP